MTQSRLRDMLLQTFRTYDANRGCLKTIIALLMFSSSLASPLIHAQGAIATEAIAGQDLYSRALFASLSEITREWGYMDDSKNLEDLIRTDWHNIAVEKYPEITDAMPTQHEDFHVQYLDQKAQIDRYERLHKEYSILIVHPMKTEGQRLEITYSIVWMKYKKRRVWHAYSDWSTVYFHFDCAKQGYELDEVKLGGI